MIGSCHLAAHVRKPTLEDVIYEQSGSRLAFGQPIHAAVMLISDHQPELVVEYAQAVSATLDRCAQKSLPIHRREMMVDRWFRSRLAVGDGIVNALVRR